MVCDGGVGLDTDRCQLQIRSLSTYGSLAITSLNVLLFIVTILLVEPWKRKRLVEGVEARYVCGESTSLKRC